MDESTSLLCLFHHEDHASAAMNDLQQAGIPQAAITSITGSGAETQLAGYGMPDHDRTLLGKSLNDGGIVLAVKATPHQVSVVERIFNSNSATFVDEFDREADKLPLAAPLASESTNTIPVLEEELVVGKRTVDQGGVRVFRRIVEIPVTESVKLHEEHVVVDRLPVDRPATSTDFNQADQTVVLTETAEEAVVSKTARVVEELTVRKESSERVEHVQDTVRHTEIDVEELPASTSAQPTRTY